MRPYCGSYEKWSDLFCIADGQLIESHETGLGWRNETVLEETNVIGDEQGLLWSITNGLVHNTSLTQEVQGIETPKIRHAPIILDDFVPYQFKVNLLASLLLNNQRTRFSNNS